MAQDYQLADTERAIEHARARLAASFAPPRPGLEAVCIDCEEPIEPARLTALAGKTSRCASCAHDFEHRSRGYR